MRFIMLKDVMFNVNEILYIFKLNEKTCGVKFKNDSEIIANMSYDDLKKRINWFPTRLDEIFVDLNND